MNSIFFREKRLSFERVLACICLSVLFLGDLAFCEEVGVAKHKDGYGCKNEKKYVKYSDMMIEKDCMSIRDSRGVRLIHELGCDENGYFIYDVANKKSL